MKKQVEKYIITKELERIRKMIDDEEDLSYSELLFLQDHQKEIMEMQDIILAEWSGITEEQWNKGEL